MLKMQVPTGLFVGAALLMPVLVAGCATQPTAAPPATPTAAATAPMAPAMTPMDQARLEVGNLENAIATRNTTEATASLDRLQALIPQVGMSATAMGTVTAGITRTRRLVNAGSWAGAAQAVTQTRSTLYSNRGGGGQG
ncbi:MAG TPA: hypothetical protein VHY76_12000 [Acetobacteraceae bacterium]|nr:hypothetical protein [Acetobacteraceae bacterium]